MLNTMKLCLALLLLLSAGTAWAGEAAEAEPLPPAVQAMLDKATQDVAKERVKYDAASKKVTDKLAADLKKEVEKATKAGNLKAALAVQAQLDEVTNGSVVAKVDEQAKDGDLLGDKKDDIKGKFNEKQKDAIRLLCSSKWVHGGQWVYFFKTDLSFTLVGTPRFGTYEISEDGATFIVKWGADGTAKETGTINGNQLTFSGGAFVKEVPKK